MNIDIELAKLTFKWIINFKYNVGNFLFHAIVYILKYKKILKEFEKIYMFHFFLNLNLGTLEAMECCKKKLTLIFCMIYMVGKKMMKLHTYKRC